MRYNFILNLALSLLKIFEKDYFLFWPSRSLPKVGLNYRNIIKVIQLLHPYYDILRGRKWADSCGIIVTKKVNEISIAFEHRN